MNCVFCSIVQEETPAYKIYADENFCIFLDKRPVFLGHCLVIPNQHIATLHDLSQEVLPDFFRLVKILSLSIESALKVDGTFVAINTKVSQSVPHFHTHVIPRKYKDGLKGFFWPRQSYENEEQIKNIQQEIHRTLLKALAKGNA